MKFEQNLSDLVLIVVCFFKKYECTTCTNVVTVTEAPRPDKLELAVNWSTLPFKARVHMILRIRPWYYCL